MWQTLSSSLEFCCGQRRENSTTQKKQFIPDEVLFNNIEPIGYSQTQEVNQPEDIADISYQPIEEMFGRSIRPRAKPTVITQDASASQGQIRDNHETRMKRIEEIDLYYEVQYDVLLGKGHFAHVFRGFDKIRRQYVAVKRINRKTQSEKTLRTEIEALLRIKGHPNIVSLFDVFVGGDHVILTMELLEGGELFNRIVSNGAYSERDASRHFRQLCEALLYMHTNSIVHRDLKPENLVLKSKSPDSEILISDFGLSKILQDDQTLMATVCGTNAYAAPEVGFNALAPHHGGQTYDAKCDTWSLGVILYVILAAYHPFDPRGDITDDLTLRDRICTYQWDFNDNVWSYMSAEVKDLIKRLLCPATHRITAAEILQHKWIIDGQNMPAKPIKGLSSRSLLHFVTSSDIVNHGENTDMYVDEETGVNMEQ